MATIAMALVVEHFVLQGNGQHHLVRHVLQHYALRVIIVLEMVIYINVLLDDGLVIMVYRYLQNAAYAVQVNGQINMA